MITTFAHLDGQLANRYDNPDATVPTVLVMRMDYYHEPYIFPTQFFVTKTARRYLEHIQYRIRPSFDTGDEAESTNMASSDEVTCLSKRLEGWWRLRIWMS